MTRRFLCIATCLALCWCFGAQLNAGEPLSSAPRTLSANSGMQGQDLNEFDYTAPSALLPTAGAAPRGVPCGPTIYDSLGLISGNGADPTAGGTQFGISLGDVITLAGTERDICRVSVIWGSLDTADYSLTLRIYDGCPVAGAALPDGACGALGAQIGGDFTINVVAPPAGQYQELEFLIDPPLTVPDTIACMFQTTSASNLMSLDAIVTVGSSAATITRCNSTTGNNGCNRNFGLSNNVGLSVQAVAAAGSGACCDRNTGICTDVAGFGDCVGAGLVFTAGMTCAQVTCDQFTGACCTEGRVCTDLLEADCMTAGGNFLGNGTTCATSACPLECQTGGFGQIPDGAGQGVDNIIAVVSDRTRPLGAADNFVPVADGNITSAKWWGLYVDLGAGAACVDGAVPDDFQITYYTSGSDGGPAFPGQIIAGPFSVGGANKVNSGFGGFGGFYEYSASHPPVAVQAGFCYWIEITNTSDTVCEWLWVVAPPGDGASAQGAPNAFVSGDTNNDFDLGFCLDIEINADGCLNALPIPGACCLNQAMNACQDSDVDACGLAGGTFLGGFTTCATSSCDGACCTGPGTNCQLSAAPIACEGLGGVFQGIGTTCSPVNPCALSACCTDGVGTCSDLTPLDCTASGGAPFVGQLCADMPNCAIGEVFLAPTIPCNSSYATNNAPLPIANDGSSIIVMSCIGGGPAPGFGEFWLTFVATDTSAFISTANSGVDDTIIEVFTDGGATPVPDSCSEDISASNFLSEVCIPTDIGTQYWILVASFDAASQGPITVDLQCPCPATCDSCPGDTNGDTKLDGADIQQFTRCLIGAEGNPDLCVCADMDDSGGVGISDVAPFVDAILNGGFCPGFPIQVCDGGTNGQTPDFENALGSSSVPADGRVADNFDTPAGGTITEISWWGVYLGDGCPDTADNFTVTIHNDDGGGTPGTVVSTLTLQTPTRVATGRNLLGIADEYKYTLSGLNINVAPGCYWLHVGNEGSAACTWFWSTSNDGDSVSAFDPDGTGYGRVTGADPVADDNDTAWCLTLAIGDGSTCFVPPPADDNCVAPQVITDGTTLVNLADGTDSGLAACTPVFPFGDPDIKADLFFSYTASCTGTLFVDTCGTATDTRLAIYNTDCTGILGGTPPIECNDDHGEPLEGDTGLTCPDQFSASLSIPVTTGETFIIRVGTFGAAPQAGVINLNVTCAAAGAGACCVGVNCSDVTGGVGECDGLGGTYLGDGTACASSVCGGACCLENGTCTAAVDGTDCIDNVAGGLFYWGDGVLCADVIGAGACPAFTPGECVYQLVLFDSFGDGWTDSGNVNTIDVFINGVSAFGGPVTLPAGNANGFIFFTAPPGAAITTTYVPTDTFEAENAWVIFDAYGNVTCEDLGGAAGPDQTPMLSCTTNACN